MACLNDGRLANQLPSDAPIPANPESSPTYRFILARVASPCSGVKNWAGPAFACGSAAMNLTVAQVAICRANGRQIASDSPTTMRLRRGFKASSSLRPHWLLQSSQSTSAESRLTLSMFYLTCLRSKTVLLVPSLRMYLSTRPADVFTQELAQRRSRPAIPHRCNSEAAMGGSHVALDGGPGRRVERPSSKTGMRPRGSHRPDRRGLRELPARLDVSNRVNC